MGDAEVGPRVVDRGVKCPAVEPGELRQDVVVLAHRDGPPSGLGHLGLEPAHALVERVHLADRPAQMAAERGVGIRRRLVQKADAVAGADDDPARVGALDAGQDPQERRLPGPVRADQAGALAPTEGEGRAREERLGVVRLAQRVGFQHGRPYLSRAVCHAPRAAQPRRRRFDRCLAAIAASGRGVGVCTGPAAAGATAGSGDTGSPTAKQDHEDDPGDDRHGGGDPHVQPLAVVVVCGVDAKRLDPDPLERVERRVEREDRSRGHARQKRRMNQIRIPNTTQARRATRRGTSAGRSGPRGTAAEDGRS